MRTPFPLSQHRVYDNREAASQSDPGRPSSGARGFDIDNHTMIGAIR
jgi:hypothetical protein